MTHFDLQVNTAEFMRICTNDIEAETNRVGDVAVCQAVAMYVNVCKKQGVMMAMPAKCGMYNIWQSYKCIAWTEKLSLNFNP